MLKPILCLSLLTTPLLAQPGGFNSLTKRSNMLSLEIYMKATEYPSDEDLKAINCTTAYPVGATPVTLPIYDRFSATFGDGLVDSTWTNTVATVVLTTVPLRADESRAFNIEGLGKGKDLNVSYDCIIPLIHEFDT